MELSADETKSVLDTLYLAQHGFDTTHGLMVTDIPEANCTWKIDNTDVQKSILKTINFLEHRMESEK